MFVMDGVLLRRAMMPIELQVMWLRLLLVALGWRSFLFLVCSFVFNRGDGCAGRLALDGPLSIQESWLALGTRVSKILAQSILDVVGIITLNVLPCIALLAVYGVAIVLGEVADALDRVGLLVYNLTHRDDIAGGHHCRGGEGCVSGELGGGCERRQLVRHNL